MGIQYYIADNGQRRGPFQKEDLALQGLRKDTLVWRSGLTDWVAAETLPELSDIFIEESAFGAYAEPQPVEEPYFAIINEKQVGPADIQSLIIMGLGPDTPVWRNGMSDWAPASTQPEIVRAFSRRTPPPVGENQHDRRESQGASNPYYGVNGEYTPGSRKYAPGSGQNAPGAGYSREYGHDPYSDRQRNNPYNNYTVPHTNWLPWAIVGSVLGFIFSCIGVVFGIIGIVNASKANDAYSRGLREEGDIANRTARTMTIIALVLSGLGFVVSYSWLSGLGSFY